MALLCPIMVRFTFNGTRNFNCLVGGRQVDGATSSFSALEKITASSRVFSAQKEGTFTVLFDSGIRQGSDVIKAIAMGAQGVLGRFIMFSAD